MLLYVLFVNMSLSLVCWFVNNDDNNNVLSCLFDVLFWFMWQECESLIGLVIC